MDLQTLIINNMEIEKQENVDGGYVNKENVSHEVWRYLLGELNDGDVNPFTDRGLEEPENLIDFVKDNVEKDLLKTIKDGYTSKTLEDDPLGYLKIAMVLVGSNIIEISQSVSRAEDKEGFVYVTEGLLLDIINDFKRLNKDSFSMLQRFIAKK